MDLLCYVSLAFVEEFKIEMNRGKKTLLSKPLFLEGEKDLKESKTIFKIQKHKEGEWEKVIG